MKFPGLVSVTEISFLARQRREKIARKMRGMGRRMAPCDTVDVIR